MSRWVVIMVGVVGAMSDGCDVVSIGGGGGGGAGGIGRGVDLSL